jgi:hypothetical protein
MYSVQDLYFRFLYSRVYDVLNMQSQMSFSTVCHEMFDIPFHDMVRHDENRIADAVNLTDQFFVSPDGSGLGTADEADLLLRSVSVFEVLIGLAIRADFMVEQGVKDWFCIFVENLDLGKYNDQYCLTRTSWPITRRIKTFNNRAYGYNGVGGIFPLKHAIRDQRKVELWYQMGSYMAENGMY